MASRPLAQTLQHEDIIHAYARWAPIYDAIFSKTLEQGRRVAAQSVWEHSHDVIDLGVGTGLALPDYRPDCRVTGIDLSHAMLKRARQLVAKGHLGNVAALLEMDACALGFADNSFDAAVATYTVTCVPSAPDMMAEACRVVRPGGQIILLSHFASENGPRAALGRCLAPIGHWLGFNTHVTVSSLMRLPRLKPLRMTSIGIAGFYQLLEFEVVKSTASVALS